MADELFRNSDRRGSVRIGARFDVTFRSARDAAKAFKTFSVNFSAGGLCVRTQKAHAVGELVQLVLNVEGQSFELAGSVQWVRSEVVGLRFIDVTPTDRARLESVAAQLLKAAPHGQSDD